MSRLEKRALAARERVRNEIRARFPALFKAPAARVPLPPPPDRTSIVVGANPAGQPVGLSWATRNLHTLGVGATGSGKSYTVVHYTRQLCANGENFILIDPHGNDPMSPYQMLLSAPFMARRKVRVIDFNSPNVVGFNPLAIDGPLADEDISVIVGNMMDVFSVTMDDENQAQKPSLQRRMPCALWALTAMKLTLAETPMLLDPDDQYGLRRRALETITYPFMRNEMKDLHSLSVGNPMMRREFRQETVALSNRISVLLQSPRVAHAIGQTTNVLDIGKAMDEGEDILVNLAGGSKAYEASTHMFGRIIVRCVLSAAERRKLRTPINFILDEAPTFFSGDIPKLLVKVRKYGISVFALMQYLDQANAYDEFLLSGLLNSTTNKIVMRANETEEAQKLADLVIPYNLETPVGILVQPKVVGLRIIKLKNEGQSEQETKTKSAAVTDGTVDGTADIEGVTEAESFSIADTETATENENTNASQIAGAATSTNEVMVPTGDPNNPYETTAVSAGSSANAVASTGHGKGHGKAKSLSNIQTRTIARTSAHVDSHADIHSETLGEAVAKGTGRNFGTSEAFEPLMADLPSAVHSLENLRYVAGRAIRALKTGSGFISYRENDILVSTPFSVPNLRLTPLPPDEFAALRDALMVKNGAISTVEAVNNITVRQQAMMSDVPAPPARASRAPPTPNPPRGKRRW